MLRTLPNSSVGVALILNLKCSPELRQPCLSRWQSSRVSSQTLVTVWLTSSPASIFSPFHALFILYSFVSTIRASGFTLTLVYFLKVRGEKEDALQNNIFEISSTRQLLKTLVTVLMLILAFGVPGSIYRCQITTSKNVCFDFLMLAYQLSALHCR